MGEYVKANEELVSLKPSNCSFVESAGVPLACLTSYQALIKRANIQKGQKVLILGGNKKN